MVQATCAESKHMADNGVIMRTLFPIQQARHLADCISFVPFKALITTLVGDLVIVRRLLTAMKASALRAASHPAL
jgi:hypothetical protein